MNGFIVFFVLVFSVIVVYLIRGKRPVREIVIFTVLSLLGATVWISIFTNNKFNPDRLIGSTIDWIGL
ncbi:hypothetical protein [Cohnella abietis]|uniref:Uncharacterized protein n=1 Tax=Cohnella abietis TaxID=2507935 RepID=A0A3T1DFC8_9BACL|nr:hypothetical protein [Cohnella abietis]BBI36585.1 hypothetical protein KCTCHS21_59840 [Cohnella abietis]